MRTLAVTRSQGIATITNALSLTDAVSMADSPTSGAQRHSLIDALRGFALIGVLLANLRLLSLYDFLPRDQKLALPTAALDTVITHWMSLFVNGTSVTLFTLLFGVGVAMQTQRRDRTVTYARRLLILLLIGCLHAYLVWWGDILRYYALLGLLLIPLARLPAPALGVLGCFTVVGLPLLLQPWLPALLPQQISSSQSAAQSLEAFSSADWGTMLDGNLKRDLRMRVAVWILPTYLFGRMLIGLALGVSGMLTHPEAHRSRWRRLWWGSLLGACVLTGLVAGRRFDLVDVSVLGLGVGAQRTCWRLVYNAAPLVLGFWYLATFVRLYANARCRALLQQLVPLGRMALTSYVSQSLLGVALFYGVGLGIGPRHGALGVVVGALAILVAQLAFARWWLARYRFGPLEWVWRSLTYGRAQPLRCELRGTD